MLFNKSFFTSEEKEAIVKAISEAEAMTSGEIRLHVEPHCKNENVLDRAVEVFYKLKMDTTAQQNGVLIYLAYKDHQFAILGDKGINHVVPANFWDSIKEVMREHFLKGEFFQGVVFAIKETGFHLKQYFPLQHNDKNELSNEISEA
jgi:uncharacterized membrane protein